MCPWRFYFASLWFSWSQRKLSDLQTDHSLRSRSTLSTVLSIWGLVQREWSSFFFLWTREKQRRVIKKWLATVITDIPLSLLTTGLFCDPHYSCVRYCTCNETEHVHTLLPSDDFSFPHFSLDWNQYFLKRLIASFQTQKRFLLVRRFGGG